MVKALALRSNGRLSAWVRTPLLAKYYFYAWNVDSPHWSRLDIPAKNIQNFLATRKLPWVGVVIRATTATGIVYNDRWVKDCKPPPGPNGITSFLLFYCYVIKYGRDCCRWYVAKLCIGVRSFVKDKYTSLYHKLYYTPHHQSFVSESGSEKRWILVLQSICVILGNSLFPSTFLSVQWLLLGNIITNHNPNKYDNILRDPKSSLRKRTL